MVDLVPIVNSVKEVHVVSTFFMFACVKFHSRYEWNNRPVRCLAEVAKITSVKILDKLSKGELIRNKNDQIF